MASAHPKMTLSRCGASCCSSSRASPAAKNESHTSLRNAVAFFSARFAPSCPGCTKAQRAFAEAYGVKDARIRHCTHYVWDNAVAVRLREVGPDSGAPENCWRRAAFTDPLDSAGEDL